MSTAELAQWNSEEALAEAMIPIIGGLHRTRSVTILLHSRSLVNKSVISILRTHRFARQISGDELSVEETFPFLEALTHLDLRPSKIDLGLLVMNYRANGDGVSIPEFVARSLAELAGTAPTSPQPQDVILYGFGRIGRLVARLLIEKAGSGNGLNLRAVVVRKGGSDDLTKRASLLRRDSVHGQFNGTIKVDPENNTLIANGNVIKFIYSNDPTSVDYTEYGIDNAILIDNTGIWRDRDGLSQHLRPGVARWCSPRPAGRRAQHCARRQSPRPRPDREHRLVRIVHHQCHCPATEGHGRRVRCRARPRRDRALLHQ